MHPLADLDVYGPDDKKQFVNLNDEYVEDDDDLRCKFTYICVRPKLLATDINYYAKNELSEYASTELMFHRYCSITNRVLED